MTIAAHTAGVRRFAATVLQTSRPRLFRFAAVTFGLTLTEAASLLLLLPLIQLVGVDAGPGRSLGLAAALERGLALVGLPPSLATLLALYVGLGALQSALLRWQSLLSFEIQQDVISALRTRLDRAMAGTTWAAFARMRASEFTHVLTSEVDRCGTAADHVLDLCSGVVIAAVYLILAVRLSASTTGLVIACGAAIAWIVRGQLRKAHGSGKAISAAVGSMHAAMAEHLGGMKTTKSYGAANRHAEIFAAMSEDVRARFRANVREHTGLRHALTLGSLASLALIVYVSRVALSVPTAQLLVLLFLAARVMPRLTSLYEKSQSLAAVLPSFDNVRDLERRCLESAEPVAESPVAVSFTRHLKFERVTFDYIGTDAPAIRDLTLEIEASRTTAIVGPSGAGKSTIADLLLGLLTPTQGRILVDDVPLSADGLESWRRHIGYVAQDTFVFHDTVRANLLWAQPSAAEADLWRALRRASADTFVTALPNGLDTVVGDRGVLISGGERQRLALARALVREPALLVLDEATSALDSENESRVQRAIDSLRHDQTIVIITHRLSAIRDVDVIHVVDGGRLVESGSWKELVDRGGRFRALYDAQGLA